jgi:hypothetical protein
LASDLPRIDRRSFLDVAGRFAVGVHMQADARRATPKLIESDYLGDVAPVSSPRSRAVNLSSQPRRENRSCLGGV